MKLGRCPTCKRLMRRSSEANRRYWLLLHALAERLPVRGQRYSADQWHLYFKSKFLGCADYKLPNGKTLVVPASSAELDVSEFNDFMVQVEEFANSNDVFLEDVVTLR